MTIQAVYQNPSDLALAVVSGELSLPLTILRRDTLIIGDWAFAFHIIGESHLVTIDHKSQMILCELLACVDVPAKICLHHHQFSDLTAHCHTQPGYTVDVHFDTQPDTIFGSDSISVEFPKIYGQTPVTRVEWLHDSGVVSWRTLHVYPQEKGITCVHSISHFDASNYNQLI